MRRHDTGIFHLALLSYFTFTAHLILMLIFEAEGKAIKHEPIGHPRTSHFINRNETSSRALDSPNLHKRSALRDHRGNPEHLSKDEFRRALDVDIDVRQSRSKGNHRDEGSHHDESESEKKIIGLFDGPPFMRGDNQTCEECVQEQQEIFKELSEKILRNEEKTKSGIMKPAYKCDDWEAKSRTCWLNRNIGDTVTFILSFSSKLKRIPKVIWKQEFHERGKEERKHFVLQRENPTWNIVIGSKGHEMRVSPISEIDVDPNLFSAGVPGEDDEGSTSALFFRIRLIPNDLGFVYPGETLVLNMASYISLPLENMHYVWYMEKDSEFDALPSNMKSSPSGSVLTISELRKEQEGVMTCAVYSNLEILVAKKRFLIKELSSNDILMNPTNRSHPFEGKRNSQHSIIRRRKPEEKIEKSLRQLESENSGLASKEGFDVDYNMDKEEFSFIDELLESSSVDALKPSDSFNRAGSKPHQKSLKLPPPASAVKMDAIQQERKSRQNSKDFFNGAQQQQYQQQEPDYQQQQGPQYQQQPQQQQQQEPDYQQQQGPQYQQQPQQQQQQEPDYQQQQGPQYQQQPQQQQQQEPDYQQQQGPQYQQQQQQLQHQQQQSQYQQGQHLQQYEQHLQQYEQKLQQQYQQQRLKQEQYEQQRLQHGQYEQQRLQQEQQQRLQQEQQQRLQQEEQQRLQQEQYEQQRLQHEQYEQQLLQQEQQQRLQQEQQQRFQQERQRLQQEQQQRLQHEQQQRLHQEQQQRLQQEQKRLQQEQQQRSKQEQQQRLEQEQRRLQQEQQRLHQEQKQQPQPHRQQEPIYPGEGREPWMEQEVSSEQSEHSAEQNFSPSLAKYSMGQIHNPKENDSFKGESFLSRQRHSTELISSVEQMARPSEQHSPNNYEANSGQIQNLSGDIPDNLRGLNMPPSGEDYPSQNFPVGVKGYSERKNMPFIQKEFPPPNFPLDNRQYSEKKTTPYNQKEYSAQNFPASHREHLKQNNVPPGENEFWSPEIFVENKETRPEDEISKIISRCENDRECAGNAACIKGQATGFCRCLPNFRGNGISCWEDMIPRNPRKFSNVKIQDRTNTGLIRSF